MYKKAFLITLLLLINSGCNNYYKDKETRLIGTPINGQKSFEPQIKNNIIRNDNRSIQAEKEKLLLELQHKEKLEKIRAQNELKIKELEAKKAKEIAKSQIEIAKIKAQNELKKSQLEKEERLQKEKEKILLYKILGAIAIFGIIFIGLIIFFIKRSKYKHQLELQKAKHSHEAWLHSTKIHHEQVQKMLDIISDENSPQELKKEMVKILENHKKNHKKLIELKK
ncbi:MAG: hypothetical protein GXO02_04455 [Epsilonproteobacteria bacterium]|nr:hypothetical protein [Campylobacterota bacterium]